MKAIWAIPAALVLLAGTAWAADNSDGGDTSALMAECGASDLPAASVDSCLERVRIHEETHSAPGLASLEARLEARVAADHEPVGPAAAGTTAVEVRPYGSSGPPSGTDVEATPQRTASAPPQPLQDEATLPGEEPAAGPDDDARPPPDMAQQPDSDADSPPQVDPEDEPPIADPPDNNVSASSPDDPG